MSGVFLGALLGALAWGVILLCVFVPAARLIVAALLFTLLVFVYLEGRVSE